MPFENIWGYRSVHKRFFGQLSIQEFMHSVELIQGDERFDALRYAINDFTEAVLPLLTEENVKTFAAFGLGAAYTNPKIKVGVVSSNEVARAMAQRYAAASPFEVKIFATMAEVHAWMPEKHWPQPSR